MAHSIEDGFVGPGNPDPPAVGAYVLVLVAGVAFGVPGKVPDHLLQIPPVAVGFGNDRPHHMAAHYFLFRRSQRSADQIQGGK